MYREIEVTVYLPGEKGPGHFLTVPVTEYEAMSLAALRQNEFEPAVYDSYIRQLVCNYINKNILIIS